IGTSLCSIIILSLIVPHWLLTSAQYIPGLFTVIEEAVEPVLHKTELLPLPISNVFVNAPQYIVSFPMFICSIAPVFTITLSVLEQPFNVTRNMYVPLLISVTG